eukprot:1158233-Pelagomonas_calceolata.AAC.11
MAKFMWSWGRACGHAGVYAWRTEEEACAYARHVTQHVTCTLKTHKMLFACLYHCHSEGRARSPKQCSWVQGVQECKKCSREKAGVHGASKGQGVGASLQGGDKQQAGAHSWDDLDEAVRGQELGPAVQGVDLRGAGVYLRDRPLINQAVRGQQLGPAKQGVNLCGTGVH